ncbi:bombesin receptor subtype-3 [Culex quinquefasciatus]|uniref:Bombesin receptor subtype-3 n=1 Tax=Culex quinquefasciatus TaxID=7176 RepID=B0XDZ5_CULQU|nr:bombesin receptor subtype-3 [Culex quinquefasciatus]|eukprot:XP_001867867.1 bombesin receptor subtype-3 [Culex quinquefasciatus]
MERRETPFCDAQVHPQQLTQHTADQNNTVYNHKLLPFPTLTRPFLLAVSTLTLAGQRFTSRFHRPPARLHLVIMMTKPSQRGVATPLLTRTSRSYIHEPWKISGSYPSSLRNFSKAPIMLINTGAGHDQRLTCESWTGSDAGGFSYDVIPGWYEIPTKNLFYRYKCPQNGVIPTPKCLFSNSMVKARRKVAITVLAFVVIFGICFLPSHLFMLWFYYKGGTSFGVIFLPTLITPPMGEQTPPGSLRMHSTVLMNFANNRCTPTPSVKTEIICAPGHQQFRRDLSKHNYCRWRSASGFPRTSHLITCRTFRSHFILFGKQNGICRKMDTSNKHSAATPNIHTTSPSTISNLFPKLPTLTFTNLVVSSSCAIVAPFGAILFYSESPNSQDDYNHFWHVLRIVGFCLSFANSCANPVALYCVSGAFRKHFNRYLLCEGSSSARRRRGDHMGHRDTSMTSTMSRRYPSKRIGTQSMRVNIQETTIIMLPNGNTNGATNGNHLTAPHLDHRDGICPS